MRHLTLPIDLFVLLFGLSALLGVVPSYDPSISLPLLRDIFLGIVLYFGIKFYVVSWDGGRSLAILLLCLTTGFALFFIFQFRYQNYPETPDFIQRLARASTFLPNLGIPGPHPNAAATLMEGFVPMAIMIAFMARKLYLRVLGLAAAFILLYAIMLSFSRGAYIALVIGLVIALFTYSWRTALIVAIVMVLVVFAGFAFADTLSTPPLNRAFEWVSGRWELYQNSLFVARDYFYSGIGLGNTFAMVYSRYGLLIQVPFLTYTHNLPLAIWMGQGLLGAIAAAGLLISFYLFVFRIIRSKRQRRVFHGAWVGVTVTLIHGLFDARQFVEGEWLMPVFFVLIGLTVATGRLSLERAQAEDETMSLRYIPRFLAPVIIVPVVAAVVIFNRPLLALWHTNRGAIDETRAELSAGLSNDERTALYDQAKASFRTALETDPGLPNASRRLGNLEVKMDEFEAAVPLLETAYAAEPGNPAARKGLGLAYLWTGRVEEAAELFKLLPDPDRMAQELDTWAFYRSEQGQPLLSAYAYDAAQRVYGVKNIAAWMGIAERYRQLGALDRALGWYEQVLDADPGNDAARSAAEEIKGAST